MSRQKKRERTRNRETAAGNGPSASSDPRTANSEQRTANPYQAGADALRAKLMEAVGALEKTGFKILKPPPGWQPPRRRKVTESFSRRQIAEVRSGEAEIPPGTDRDAYAAQMELELEQELLANQIADTAEEAGHAIYAEIEARYAQTLPGALAVYHEAKALVAADPNHPVAPWLKEMDRALREAQGGREASRKPGSKPRKGGGRGKGGRKRGGKG